MKIKTQNIFWLSISFFLCLSVTFLFNRSWGKLPPLISLLNPHSGIWNHKNEKLDSRKFAELQSKVRVAMDEYGVPHIFAENDHDLYFVQGYLHARQRLFQMDLTTRVTAGRLGEWIGEKGESYDRYFVQFGMRDFAESTKLRLLADPQIKLAVEAYLAGVNARIKELNSATLPPEYKLLQVQPEKFDTIRVSHLLATMSYNLAGRSFDLPMSLFKKKYGVDVARQLWPEFFPRHLESFDGKPAPARRQNLSAQVGHKLNLQKLPWTFQPPAGNGSNNFAVGPEKSATGDSIVANDTHLSYSLPNVWFENHLVTPSLNVYGVSFPMGPGVVLGFNAKTAWAVTNATTDVLDWFEVEFKDESSWLYKVGEGWKEALVKIEKSERKGKSSIIEIQVVQTQYGYLMHREGKWGIVSRWIGPLMGRELSALFAINRGQSMADCRRALDANWFAPAQNWICADRKNISIKHQGWLPWRKDGEGQFVEAAREEAWQKEIPFRDLPQSTNPPEGFVRSANQRPRDASYAYNLAWDFEDASRAENIRLHLSEKQKFQPLDLIGLQNNVEDLTAKAGLPLLLKYLKRSDLNGPQKLAIQSLVDWDFKNQAESPHSTLFKEWWKQLRELVMKEHWSEDWGPIILPRNRLQAMLESVAQDSRSVDSKWIPNLEKTVTESFQGAWKILNERFGSDYEGWLYANYRPTRFPHLLRLSGFEKEEPRANGSSYTIFSNKGDHGPVYTMVMSLGERPAAWSIVPGGNEGDPFAPGYGISIDDWAMGKPKAVRYWMSWEEAEKSAKQVVEFSGGEP